MLLSILKPGETVLKVDVSRVTLPGTEGQMTPMEGHDRLLALIERGNVSLFTTEGEEEVREEYEISRGIAEVTHTDVTLFVDEAKRATP